MWFSEMYLLWDQTTVALSLIKKSQGTHPAVSSERDIMAASCVTVADETTEESGGPQVSQE